MVAGEAAHVQLVEHGQLPRHVGPDAGIRAARRGDDGHRHAAQRVERAAGTGGIAVVAQRGLQVAHGALDAASVGVEK